MYQDELEEFEELKERWLKRAKRLTDLKDMTPAFNYSALEQGKIPSFNSDNWNDPAIKDLRAILFELDYGEVLTYDGVTIQAIRISDE